MKIIILFFVFLNFVSAENISLTFLKDKNGCYVLSESLKLLIKESEVEFRARSGNEVKIEIREGETVSSVFLNKDSSLVGFLVSNKGVATKLIRINILAGTYEVDDFGQSEFDECSAFTRGFSISKTGKYFLFRKRISYRNIADENISSIYRFVVWDSEGEKIVGDGIDSWAEFVSL